MESSRHTDGRSLVIGLLCGLILALALALGGLIYYQQWPGQDESAGPPALSETAAPAHAEQIQLQRRVERDLEKKAQSLLDDLIGADRSIVRVHAIVAFRQENVREHTASPDQQAVSSEETREKSSAEQGTEEYAVRTYEIDRRVLEVSGPRVIVERLQVALSVDKTKVVYDYVVNEYVEEDRSPEEIGDLSRLVGRAVGFDGDRGDQIAVVPMAFDRTQEIVQRERAEAEARKRFWTDALVYALGLAAVGLLLRWFTRGRAGLDEFVRRPEGKGALFLATGIFFSANGLGWFGDSLELGEIGLFPGSFFLLVGAGELWRHLRANADGAAG